MKLVSLPALAALVSVSFAFDDTSDARKAIEAQFAKISKAFEAKDVKTFEAMFAPDFKAKAPGRPVASRAEVLKDFEGQMKVMSDVKWSQKIKTFKLEKGVATVTFDSELKSKAQGQDNMPHDFRLTSKTKNEWVKGKPGWQVRYSESLELRMWVDGQEIKNEG